LPAKANAVVVVVVAKHTALYSNCFTSFNRSLFEAVDLISLGKFNNYVNRSQSYDFLIYSYNASVVVA
jgi:hypothetical protein